MKQKIKVLLGTTSYNGKLDVYYVNSLLYTLDKCSEHDVIIYPYFICYDALIQRARNDVFKAAYELGADVLFFIDDDIGWSPDNFFKLIKSDKDFIGGSYRKKQNEEAYVLKILDKTNESLNFNIQEDGLMEVDGLGFGFVKMSRKVIEFLWNNSEKYFSEKGECRMISEIGLKNNEIVSEDIFVCHKWIKANNKIYLDTNITCSHTGTINFTGDVQAFLKKIEANQSQQQSPLSNYTKQSFLSDQDYKVLV